VRRTFLAALVLTLLLSRLSPADTSKTAVADKSRWTVDDVLMTEAATGFQISPDCRWVVWVKAAHDKDKGERVAHLVRSSLSGDEEVQLTRGPESCQTPRWSPDGKLVAFLTSRSGAKIKPPADEKHRRRHEKDDDKDEPKQQVWLINPFGGEPWPLTEVKRGVTLYEWADADTILFTAQEDPTLHEETVKKEKKDTSILVDDEKHEPPVRLFQVSVTDRKVRRLTDNPDRITAFFPAPDGKRAVTVHDRSLDFEYDNQVKPAVYLTDLKTGAQRQLFAERQFNIQQVRWTPDGKGFYAANEHTSHPQYVQATITDVYFYDLTAGKSVKVDLGWANGLGTEFEDWGFWASLHPTADGFLALLADGVHEKAARYRRVQDQWERQWLDGTHAGHLFGLQLGKDGKTLLYSFSKADQPTQWYRCTLDGARLADCKQVTHNNAGFQDKTRAKVEVVRWKGALDEEVEGLLYYPHRYEAGKIYPLVVMIHGGPAWADFDAWEDSWAYPMNLMCQRGAFVLRPNYHGSANYGLKWVESISGGKYYDLEVPDIEKGVDALIGRGLVDPNKLGVLGWSNGGILTTALTVTTTRYKVAAAGAGDVDWISDWGNCEFGASFDNYYFGKSPLEDPELYRKKSPFYRLDRVRTPTIIFFGTEDRKVPAEQGWMHYRALQQLGKTDVRFLLFPGEQHSPQKLVHQRRKLQEELAWFDRYLFHPDKEADESLKEDSPLARLLQLKKAKRDGGRYGVLDRGRLVPETVEYEEMEVGRFEVTRAQYAQFDKAYTVEPGKENYPANGIPFERARAYCEWLSRETGQTYRLPTEKEAETLYDAPDADDNTLDAWAGYAVNPDDAERLRDKLKELGGKAPLLKEVGSGKGSGEDPVFDLGGNVAEWVVHADGKGRACGGSADTPADARLERRKPAAEYVGFRVVKGKPK
jgi:dipeptidyl aminopeptidase/acylaminoacyl peptidase